MNYVYFAKSKKNSKVYVGFTKKDPKTRIKEHNQGSNKWTSQNKPLVLVYYEKYYCEKDARMREKFYKTGVGKQIKSAILENLKKK